MPENDISDNSNRDWLIADIRQCRNREYTFVSISVMKQKNSKYGYTFRRSAIILASVLLISGCAAFKAEKKKDPFAGKPFLPEHSQIGWLWTGENELPVPYVPREGDIILSSSIAPVQSVSYRLFGNVGLPHHIMLVAKNGKGELGIFEVGAGKDKSVVIRPIHARLKMHKEDFDGSVVAVRQVKRALTPCESQRLTSFAESQIGKEFSSFRQLRGLGFPNRPSNTDGRSTETWFCSQLAIQALVDCGLITCLKDPGKISPEIVYHDKDFDFSGLWTKPTDWTYEQKATTTKPLLDPSRLASKSRGRVK